MSQQIGACTITTTDTHIGGAPVRYHTIRTEQETGFGLHSDIGLSYAGWVRLEPNSLLIDQASTAARMGRPAGFLPEERLMAQWPDCLAFVPSNYWQRGTILLHASSEGGPDLFAGSCPDGVYSFIIKTAEGWEAASLKFSRNKPDKRGQGIIDRAELGFSMPLILQNGRVRSLNEYADDPRVVGDTRNFADYGFGRTGLPADFWLFIRRVMPNSGRGLLAVLRGEEWVETRESFAMTPEEFTRFQRAIESAGLSCNLKLKRVADQLRLTIVGLVPVQRIPAVGVGFDPAHNLVAVVAEGRQPHSVGVSSEQLAQIMLDEGVLTGGLGSAGGDAGIWANVGGEFRTLSSGPYRPAPCLLIMG